MNKIINRIVSDAKAFVQQMNEYAEDPDTAWITEMAATVGAGLLFGMTLSLILIITTILK